MPKVLREGSTAKRADILAAASDLFLTDGFDRSSVDAVAAKAGVSKRTVYDYFGDKRTLLLAVVQNSAEILMASVNLAIDEELADVSDLEKALVAFSRRLNTTTRSSRHYTVLTRLVSQERSLIGNLEEQGVADAPEEQLARRFAELAEAGILEAPEPRVAADHFTTLAVLPGFRQDAFGTDPETDEGKAARAKAEKAMIDGVQAFLRAYTKR
ncbi:N/A [soil metagenome]